MILDSGIMTVFRDTDANGTGAAGKVPVKAYANVYTGWYGELAFETSPAYPTEGRREKKTDARIRILQNRNVKQNDIVVLEMAASWSQRTTQPYKITRVYHGPDDTGAAQISDLSLEVYTP